MNQPKSEILDGLSLERLRNGYVLTVATVPAKISLSAGRKYKMFFRDYIELMAYLHLLKEDLVVF